MGLFDAEFAAECSTGPASQEWTAPTPLPSDHPAVLPFDVAVLPAPFVDWVGDIALRMQVPPEFIAVPAMIAAGAVIGRKIGIRPQRSTDWHETPNLWGCIIGRPGVLKSPAVQAGLKPLNDLQAVARREFSQKNIEYDASAFERELRADAVKKQLKESFKLNARADVSELRLTDEPEPKLRRYLVNDTSYQSLGVLLMENPNGLLTYRDELVSLMRSLDREENAEARGFYLTGWNGTDDYTFDRISRGNNLYVPSLTISMIGSTQPARIAEYASTAIRGGAGDDGLIQRFSLMVWPDGCSAWKDHDREPDSFARRQATETFNRLDKITPPAVGAQQDPVQENRPFLRFSDDALAEFQGWRYDHERRLRSGDLHPAMESHLAKYRKLVPALALIHHLASGGTGPVGVSSVSAARGWASYLESHAVRIYACALDSSSRGGRTILKHVRRGDLGDVFTARDVARKGWTALATREQVSDALDLLQELNWLRIQLVHPGPTGGRPTFAYAVNPEAMRQ